ncbi:MAG: hypothetical protein U9R20_00880 [Thermodesulfobacteriota bacterium]|nr:hypothetical protein [Thermodesulfobacteriota bacterium]
MKLRIIGVLLISLLLSFSCTQGLNSEERKQIEILRSELEEVHKEVATAQTELSKYAGGLIQSLLLARIEILKTTEALIQQRIHAIEGSAPVSIQTLASKQDINEAEKLATEINKQEAKLREAEIKAGKYSGGLLKAIALSTVATQAQTLAMLRQQFLISKLGLSFPTYKIDTSSQTPSNKEINTSPVAVGKKLEDDIISVKLVHKDFTKQEYQEFIFFNLQYTASGLDKPARAIKGLLNLNDLFGEKKLVLRWTIEKPIKPGESIEKKGQGFKFSPFENSHQWVRNTPISDMKTTFTVSSILYQDGTRRDFE